MIPYAIIGALALVFGGGLIYAIHVIHSSGEEVGKLATQKSDDDTAIAAVEQKANIDDDVAKMSAADRRSELRKWVR